MATTRGKSEVARGADVPLSIAQGSPTRDALLDPREGDIIPDLEEKGYHVGEVAQPAEPVLRGGGSVEFESLPEAPETKFRGVMTYAEQVAANEKWQAEQGDLYEGRLHEPVETDQDKIDARVAELQKGSRPARSSARADTGSGAASKLEDDANAVASKQAAEDRK